MSTYDIEPNDTGRRLREIRAWRGQSLEVTAGLAGISFGHLGKLERGDAPLSNRRTLEAGPRFGGHHAEELAGLQQGSPWTE